jgi:predicted Zn-dependent protease
MGEQAAGGHLILRGRLARELAVIGAALALLALAAFAGQRLLFPRQVPTPDIAQSLDDALGPLLSQQIRSTQRQVTESVVADAFGAIMGRLLPAMPGRPMNVEVLVIDSPEINAFTLPGRVICVDTGLIREMKSAEQMAAVIGHELGHVANRDPLTLLARQMGMSVLAAAVTGGQAAALLSSMVQTLVNVHYGREAEDRADAFSVHLLARAGIPPDSFCRALSLIGEAAPKRPGLLLYIDPHSPLDKRIARAREQARQEQFAPRELPLDWKSLLEALPHS